MRNAAMNDYVALDTRLKTAEVEMDQVAAESK